MGVMYEGNYYQGISSIGEMTVGDSLDDYNWVHPDDIWMFIRKGGLEGEINAYEVGWYPPYGPFPEEPEDVEGSGADHRFKYFAEAESLANDKRAELAERGWNVLMFVDKRGGKEPYGAVIRDLRRRSAVVGEHPIDTMHRATLADSHPHKRHAHNQDCSCEGP